MVTKYRKYCAVLLLMWGIQLISAQAHHSEQAWYKIYNRAVSDSGRWIFFTKAFDVGQQEGILRNTQTGTEITITAPGKFFLNDDYFLVINAGRSLVLQDLHTGSKNIFEGIVDYHYDAASKKLILQKENEVSWLDLTTSRQQKHIGFTSMEPVVGTPCVLLYNENETALMNTITGISVPLAQGSTQIRSFIARSETKSIRLLLQKGTAYTISTIDYSGKKIRTAKTGVFDTEYTGLSFLSENIILGAKALKKEVTAGDTVEVWSSRDKALKPRLMNLLDNAQMLEVWDLKYGASSKKSYTTFSTAYYIIFNEAYLLEVQELENYSFTVNDMAPRPKIVLRHRFSGNVVLEVDEVRAVYPSAKGDYLLYFKDHDWFCYEAASGITSNISGVSGAPFYKYDRLNTTVPHPVDRPFFSTDYQFIYLTSKNDVWRYSLKKNQLQKITDYKNKKISFTIREPSEGNGVKHMVWNGNAVLKNDFIVLRMDNNETELEEGLAVLKKEELTVIEKPAVQRIDQIQNSAGAVTYVTQDSNTPPKMMTYIIGQNTDTVSQGTSTPTNVGNFPRTELRHWINSEGKPTYTTIVLPPDYSPLKKYPAIVRIYENEAKRYKEFEYPSYHSPTGFNRILLAQQGYIIILPKISYLKNQVGESALQSVEETVKKVQTWFSVDAKNIGLIGHSFGGYETNYIITQSNMFKTAISGGSIANIISDYFTVHKMYKNSNISRYTNEQFSFTDEFYNLKKKYEQNNPILMADQIKIPLLLWSGKDDDHVECRQSVEMFMALASLNKEVRLLLFPHDPHVLSKPENQVEATIRINEWFGYFLKNEKKPLWY